MRTMTDRRIRRLPVVSGERVVGMLFIGDLVRAIIEEQERTIADLETYTTGEMAILAALSTFIGMEPAGNTCLRHRACFA